MSLDSFFEPAQKAAQLAKLDLFHFVSRGKVTHRLRVIRFNGEERVNDGYDFDVELLAPQDLDPLHTLEEELLGHPGSLVMMDASDEPRMVHGVVTGYEVIGSLDRESVRLRLRLSPRFSLLKMRYHSRIFQEETVPAIVSKILGEWRVPHVFELVGSYTPRTYCTQYHETDFDFVRRILAREGIYFYFRQGPDAEVEQLVFADEALYKRLPGLRGKLSMRSGRFEIGEGDIVEMGIRRRLRPTAARIGDFDFKNPRLPMRSLEVTSDPKGVAGDLGSEKLGTYEFSHEAEHEVGASAQRRDQTASRMLQSLRGDGLLVIGTSRSRKLLPAHSFELEGHSLESLNREWVVQSVVHQGQTPEFGADGDDVYVNEFEAVPIETALRLPVETRRRVVHGTQTGTVVGGGDGEVFTDTHGRVKVQFHWDLEGQGDERSSCFIRVAQPWAGSGFGSQFLPRVGSEVVVSFLDGDPDRPIIVGSVYNGTHPPPFGLPTHKGKSGFRTMSTPGAGGSSELSFDDEKGRELMLLKAQRNLELDVGQDHAVGVTGNSTLRVAGQRTENVAGTQTVTVAGGITTLASLHMTTQVLGNVIHAVRGDEDRRVSGDENVRVEGTQRLDIASQESFVHKDAVHRVRGHATMVVGDEGRPATAAVHVEGTLAGYASKATELIAEEGIVLRCGESQLRIGPNRIEIISPTVTLSGQNIEAGAEDRVTLVSKDGIVLKGERLHAMGKSSSLLLFTDADIGGNKVKLNCVVDEAAVVAKPKPITRIELTDEDGTPARRRRFIIVTKSGERSGVLDDRGCAELELEDDATIYFPDVDKPREA
jgi:type VI secretion system secreted protein VgrG